MDSGRSLFGYNQCDGLGCFGVEWDIRFQSTAYRHGRLVAKNAKLVPFE